MIQLVTQYAGFGLFAQIALALFFLAFMMILVSTLIRPRSQMQHYARMALSDDVAPAPAPGITPGVTPAPGVTPGIAPAEVFPEVTPGPSHGPVPQADAEHGAAHHE